MMTHEGVGPRLFGSRSRKHLRYEPKIIQLGMRPTSRRAVRRACLALLVPLPTLPGAASAMLASGPGGERY